MPKRAFSPGLEQGALPPDGFSTGTPVPSCKHCAEGWCSKHNYWRTRWERIEKIEGSTWKLVPRLPSDCSEQRARTALVTVLQRRAETQPRTLFELLDEDEGNSD